MTRTKSQSFAQSCALSQLGEAGVEFTSSGSDHEYTAGDLRRVRRHLEQKLTLDEGLRRQFLDGMQEHLEAQDVLLAALKPVAITGPVRSATSLLFFFFSPSSFYFFLIHTTSHFLILP
jgi:hypothetical protein